MRTYYVLGGSIVVALALGTALFFLGPPSLQSDVNTALTTDATSAVPFTVLAQGTDAISVNQKTNYRITNNEELQALWPMIYGTSSAPPLPRVDFTKYEILGVFDGTHSTGGYAITVHSIIDANGTRTVAIGHTVPGSGCTPPTNPSSPFVVVQVPITNFTLAHQDTTTTTMCP